METLLIILVRVEVNPGPATKKTNLLFAVWNLDSIPARDYATIPLVESSQGTYQFHIFWVCESLLNKNILTTGFSAQGLPTDKPENIRNGGVCLYFKEYLPIKERRELWRSNSTYF